MRRAALAFAVLFLTSLPVLTPSSAFAQDATLRVGQTRSGTLAAGDTARFTFEAGDDYLLYGEVNQIDVDVVVTLVNAEGQRVGPSWDSPARGAEAFSTTLDEAGTYTLRVAPFEDETGNFEITILLLEEKSDDPAKLADQLMFAYDRPGGPGGAIQVWQNGRTLFSKAYGLADLTHGIDFETTTPTNIGSTSKQFTAFAVLLEQERGNLSLDDDIREYFPELPDRGETITIRNLLTHTSGLREFLNLWAMAGVDARGLTRDDVLRAAERQPALQNVPGGEFNYNNTAFSLAAQIVEQTSGEDFDDYMRKNVFEPLGMNDSYVRMNPQTIIPGRADGYTPSGDGWMAPGDLGGAVGAGGIYASVEDLERWGRNLASPTVGTPEMVEAMMTEFMLNDGEGSGYGLGLFIDEQRGLKRVHHGGADISHRSMIVYYPEIGAGLTAQSNGATFNSNGTAFDLGAAFFGDAMEPEEEAVAEGDEPFDPETWDRAEFAVVEGTYTLDPAPQIQARFWESGDTLYTQLTNQPPAELRPTSPTSFELIIVDARIVFEVEEDAEKASGFTLFQNGQEIHATRVEDEEVEAVEEWNPTPEDLKAFEGRFYSQELEAFYTFEMRWPDEEEEASGEAEAESPEAGDEEPEEEPQPRLVGHHLRLGDFPLRPTERDTFSTGAGITVQFERDRNGQVIGFYVDYTRTRDVRFERVR